MRLRNVVCAACGALAFAAGATGQTSASPVQPEPVKLEYKLQPGAELIYKASGILKENVSATNIEETFSGLQRFVIADVDAATGVMLVGQLPTMSIKVKRNDTSQEQNVAAASVCRLDRSGNRVFRKAKNEGKFGDVTGWVLQQLDRRELDTAPLPGAPLAVGATWEESTKTGLPGLEAVPCKVLSTLAEIKTMDGHKCAVIQSKITPTGQMPGAIPLQISGVEEVETVFDIEGGFSRSEKSKLDFKMNAFGQAMSMTGEGTATLDSVKMLPAEQAARESGLVRAFDAAVATAYDGDCDKAVSMLEALKPAELPEAWKSGIDNAISTLKQVAQLAKGGPPFAQATPAEQAQELFAQAEQARQDQKWAEAAAKYKELAERYPDHALAPAALIEAARIAETNLNDKKSADELRQRALALQEKRAAGDPMELYKLAALCADSGDLEKAVATYRKFLASEDAKIPASARALAQYRLGGLLEKQGKKAEAAEAYRALAAMPADDDYSTKLKEQAKKRLDALAGQTNQ